MSRVETSYCEDIGDGDAFYTFKTSDRERLEQLRPVPAITYLCRKITFLEELPPLLEACAGQCWNDLSDSKGVELYAHVCQVFPEENNRVSSHLKLSRHSIYRHVGQDLGFSSQVQLSAGATVRSVGLMSLNEKSDYLGALEASRRDIGVKVFAIPTETTLNLSEMNSWMDLDEMKGAPLEYDSWIPFMINIVRLGGIYFRPFGEFDDREVTLDVMGRLSC